jgi:hypothetical protein
MPQSSADSEDESAPSEGCGVLALFLRSSDRICKTSTKSWSVNWRARFFSLDLRRCAFFKSFATRCFSIFACCCSNFNRLICCDNDSPPTAGATGITAGILADPVVGGRLDAAPVSSVVSTAAGAATSPADAAAGISSDDIGWLEAEGSCDNLCFGFELRKTCVPTRGSHPEPMQRYGTLCSRLRLRRKARNRRTQSNIKVHCEVHSGCGDAAKASRTLHAMTNCFRFSMVSFHVSCLHALNATGPRTLGTYTTTVLNECGITLFTATNRTLLCAVRKQRPGGECVPWHSVEGLRGNRFARQPT